MRTNWRLSGLREALSLSAVVPMKSWSTPSFVRCLRKRCCRAVQGGSSALVFPQAVLSSGERRSVRKPSPLSRPKTRVFVPSLRGLVAVVHPGRRSEKRLRRLRSGSASSAELRFSPFQPGLRRQSEVAAGHRRSRVIGNVGAKCPDNSGADTVRRVQRQHGTQPLPNKSLNRTFYCGPSCSGFAIFASGRAAVKRRLAQR